MRYDSFEVYNAGESLAGAKALKHYQRKSAVTRYFREHAELQSGLSVLVRRHCWQYYDQTPGSKDSSGRWVAKEGIITAAEWLEGKHEPDVWRASTALELKEAVY